MKKYLKLSGKYLIKYPKRTMAMILSIVLSVFFVVTIGSLSQSSRMAEMVRIKAIAGNQHVTYGGIDSKGVEKIKSNPRVKRIANLIYYDTGTTKEGLTVNLLEAEENILYMEDIQILKGSFPTKANEIAMEEWVLERLDVPKKLGQTINISLQQRGGGQKFILTGIIKNRMDEKATGNLEAYLSYSQENAAGRGNAIYSLVEFKEETDLKREIRDLGEALYLKNQDIIVNTLLLDILNKLQGIDWELIRTASVLMLVGTMVIYSLYNISSLKRIQQYGLLRAMGATKKQLIFILLGEMSIIYILGSLLGVLTASLFVQLFEGVNMELFSVVSPGGKLEIIRISSRAVLLALVTALGSVFLGGMKGLWRVTKIMPVETIQKSTLDRRIKFKEREGKVERALSIANRISYKNLMRNKRTLLFTAITMTIGCSLYMVGSFRGEMFDREREYYNDIYKGKTYEFTLNVNDTAPMKQAYSLGQIKELENLPQVEDVLARGVLYSRIKFPTKSLNGSFGQNYLKEMEKRDKSLRSQLEIPIEGKSGFFFQGEDKGYTLIRSTLLGLSQEELKPLENTLLSGTLPSSSEDKLEALLYLPKITEKGAFFGPPGQVTYEPILNLNVGDKIKLAYPQKGYEQLIENYSLIMDYEKYRDFYVSREVVITSIVDELPVEDNFHLGSSYLPYLLIPEEHFKELTGIEGYRILSIDMKDDASEKEYRELRKRVQQLAKAISGTNLMDEMELQKSINTLGRQTKTLQNTIAGILIFISGLSIYTNISYNLFSHLREYGILKAVGLTKKQFKKMIQFEGLIYGAISAFFACSISFVIQLGLFLFNAYISSYPLYHKQFFLDWKPYILVIGINIIIGYLATLGPIHQVNKTEITEAIRTVE